MCMHTSHLLRPETQWRWQSVRLDSGESRNCSAVLATLTSRLRPLNYGYPFVLWLVVGIYLVRSVLIGSSDWAIQIILTFTVIDELIFKAILEWLRSTCVVCHYLQFCSLQRTSGPDRREVRWEEILSSPESAAYSLSWNVLCVQVVCFPWPPGQARDA